MLFSWVLGSRPWLFFFTGPWLPSLAVFLHVHWARVSFNLLLTPGCFIVASGEPSAHPLADSFSVCLAPVAGCDRVSISCSKHAMQNASLASLQALGTDTDGCLRRGAPRHGPHDSHGFLASLPASPRPQRHATLFRWLSIQLRHQTSLAAPPERSAACITSLHSFLCATVEHCTFFHVQPHLQVLCVVCSPLSSLSWSAGPSSTTLRAESPQHAPPHAAGGLLVLQRRSRFWMRLPLGAFTPAALLFS